MGNRNWWSLFQNDRPQGNQGQASKISWICSGAVWIITLVEGIISPTKSDEEFYQTFDVGRHPWF